MKWIQKLDGELINVNHIVDICPMKKQNGRFNFYINLSTGTYTNIGDYSSENILNQELKKLKDFLIDDKRDFYYYIEK